MPTTETPKNRMADTWTEAAKVRRAFNAGPRRKKDLRYADNEEAVLEAYASALELRKDTKKAGLSVRDIRAALVLMEAVYEGLPITDGRLMVLAIPDTIKGLPELLRATEKHTKDGTMVPLGIAFWQRDRDPKAKTGKTAWVQPWLVNARAARAAETARKAFEEADGRIPEDGLNETFAEN